MFEGSEGGTQLKEKEGCLGTHTTPKWGKKKYFDINGSSKWKQMGGWTNTKQG